MKQYRRIAEQYRREHRPQSEPEPIAARTTTTPDPMPALHPPAPFLSQREWTRALHVVEAAEITLTAASHHIWDPYSVPAAFEGLRHLLYAAIAHTRTTTSPTLKQP
ncbi:hypothetical protein ACFTXJ_00845 [Streptomyces zhihengii]|uniref:hypothetical protein n=1 Tax=Streptomyces zhihengii TaxID=1818004 RepID=UPI0036306CF3